MKLNMGRVFDMALTALRRLTGAEPVPVDADEPEQIVCHQCRCHFEGRRNDICPRCGRRAFDVGRWE